eukprot:TRINITY_DN90556_c0_g1_i1.p1 TRINITY_DN90556_c0_g1~~TRINITY_DN90556_c0_g1_i1.p1  ORF type:complete len:591 (-),score=131.79 TRINITY_DN90556_c0_g1_i1:198-1970(-)
MPTDEEILASILAGGTPLAAAQPPHAAGLRRRTDDDALRELMYESPLSRAKPAPSIGRAGFGSPIDGEDLVRSDASILASIMQPSPTGAAAATLAEPPGKAFSAAPRSALFGDSKMAQHDDAVVAALLAQSGTPHGWSSPGSLQGTLKEQQLRDDAALLAAIVDEGALSAGSFGGGRLQPPFATQDALRRKQDDEVLDELLFGRSFGSTARPAAVPGGELTGGFSGFLGGSSGGGGGGFGGGCAGKTEDDMVLAKLLGGASATPLLVLVDDIFRGARDERQRATVVAGGYGRGDQAYQLSRPMGIALDSMGALLIADNGNGRLLRWPIGATQGQVVPDLGHCFKDICGLALDHSGAVLCTASGALLATGAAAGRGDLMAISMHPSELTFALADGAWPTGVAVEAGGAILFTDTLEHTVVRLVRSRNEATSPVMRREIVAGSRGKGSRLQQLHRPFATVSLGDGSILVLDSGNHRVVRWAKGAQSGDLVAGGRGKGNHVQQLNHPLAMVLDAVGTLVIADTLNHRIVRWHPGASRGEVLFGGCGQGSRLEQLNKPSGLVFDGMHLLIADSGNHRILRVPYRPRVRQPSPRK